ncbi:unnamed protein product [Pleuronectes platessa]|uniref:Uncharacterized protein n=1 Tax=Pleuronectes platessa TaxID=8262 RepID=A0A9N7U2X7_PLEPL|nr:unnamed protein product [Pleuronectes platessa]
MLCTASALSQTLRLGCGEQRSPPIICSNTGLCRPQCTGVTCSSAIGVTLIDSLCDISTNQRATDLLHGIVSEHIHCTSGARPSVLPLPSSSSTTTSSSSSSVPSPPMPRSVMLLLCRCDRTVDVGMNMGLSGAQDAGHGGVRAAGETCTRDAELKLKLPA